MRIALILTSSLCLGIVVGVAGHIGYHEWQWRRVSARCHDEIVADIQRQERILNRVRQQRRERQQMIIYETYKGLVA